MALAESPVSSAMFGRALPRLAPPVPLRSELAAFREQSDACGIAMRPWQDVAGTYLNALGPEDLWLYPEVAVIVARQNGKTTLLVPHIIRRLRAGRRIMHSAQNRELPREVFGLVAAIMVKLYPNELARMPRYANGQEEIRTLNGGVYRIVAPTRGGARGPSNDDLIVDELREMDTHDFMSAAKPTLAASPNPQILYLSNAGTDDSVVLNALRTRSLEDPSLAYLEWSAAPHRSADDREGWFESNPSIGHNPTTLAYLEREFVSNKLAGTLAIFETEHLCRWVPTMRERLVDVEAFAALRGKVGTPRRPFLAVSMDPSGTRASALSAWLEDETIHLRSEAEVFGEPTIDLAAFGKDLRARATSIGVQKVGFDSLTDAELAKYFKDTEALVGRKMANASAQFVNLVKAGRIVWEGAEAVAEDLVWTSRKAHDESGAFEAVRAKDDRSITAALAAVRAVWLASNPAPSGLARIY